MAIHAHVRGNRLAKPSRLAIGSTVMINLITIPLGLVYWSYECRRRQGGMA
jgi:hypothetical protein